MDDLDDDDPLQPFNKSKKLNETVENLQHDLSIKENECSFIKANLQSDISKLNHKLKTLKTEREEDGKHYREENQRNLDAAYKQYEKNVNFIRNRHQENIQTLQAKHEEQLQTTIHKYEEQISQIRRQIQELPNLRISLQSKEDEIQTLQEEMRNNKKNYDDKVAKLIQDLEDEKVEEQAEKWDLKKYVEIFKKRCLVLETMLENLQRNNIDLKEKIKDTTKNCDIKTAKVKIDFETRQRCMEEELQNVRQELEKERQKLVREQNKTHQKLEQDHITFESKILMLQGQIEEQQKIREAIERKNADLDDKTNVFRDTVSKIKDQYEITLNEIRIENDLKNKKHKKEVDKLVHQIEEAKLKAELEINQEKIRAGSKIEELTKILKDEKWTIPRPKVINQEIQTSQTDLQKEAEKLRDLENLKQQFSDEKSEYENTIQRLSSEMDEQKECFVKIIELKQQLEVTSINLESSSESNKKYFKEFIKLKKDFDTAKKHYDIQLRKHHQEIQKYQNLNKDLTGKYEKLKKEYDLQIRTCTSVQKHRQELQEANEDMKEKFGQTTKAIDTHMEVLKTTIDDNKLFYMDTVLQLKQEIETQMKKQVLLEEKAEQALEEAVEKEKSKISHDVRKLQKERQLLIQKLHEESENGRKLSKDLEEQTELVTKSKNEHSAEISKIRQHYEKEMKHTDDLILILTNDLEHNNKKYNKLKQLKAKTISSTRSQITSIQKTYEEKIRNLEKQLQSSNNLLEITNTNLKTEIQQLLLNQELLEKSKLHVETENERYQIKIQELTKICQDQQKEPPTISELKEAKENEEYVKKLKEDIIKGKTYIEQLIEIKSNLESKLKTYEHKVLTLQKYIRDTLSKYNKELTAQLTIDDDVVTFERHEHLPDD